MRRNLLFVALGVVLVVPLSSPAQGRRGGAPVRTVAIAAGLNHTCAITSAPLNNMTCWGLNDRGQLGDGTNTNRPTPVQVNLGLGAIRIAAGAYHTCAVVNRTPSVATYCWGDNSSGQLGFGSHKVTSAAMVQAFTAYPMSRVMSLAAGSDHTCLSTPAGTVFCWGSNRTGESSGGSGPGVDTAAVIVPGTSGLVAAGRAHSCAVVNNGTQTSSIQCWGYNRYGEAGNDTMRSVVPVSRVAWNGPPIGQVAAGHDHTCVLTQNPATVMCWGMNANGQLGNGRRTISATPVSVVGLHGRPTFVATGVNHSCAVLASGGVDCWGSNNHGQLGNNSTVDSSQPVSVRNVPAGVIAVAAGAAHTCVLTSTSAVVCWGANQFGQLGDGTFAERHTP